MSHARFCCNGWNLSTRAIYVIEICVVVDGILFAGMVSHILRITGEQG